MLSNTFEPKIVRVSQKGQTTIPKALREKFAIETPGEVFIYESSSGIVIEPVPTVEELHGAYSSEKPEGEILEAVREERNAEKQNEAQREAKFSPKSRE